MPWSPLTVGDGRPSHHTFTTDGGVFVLTNLSSSAISLHMVAENGTLYVCTGTWTITTSTDNNTADFTPSVADLTTGPFSKPDLYTVYPVVTLPTGPVAMDAQRVQVIARQ